MYIFCHVHPFRRWKNFTTSILDAWQFWLFHLFQVFQMHKAHESLIWDSMCIKHKRTAQLLTVHILLLSLKICFVCWILFGYRDRNRANKYCTLKNLHMVRKKFRKSVIQKVSYVTPFLLFFFKKKIYIQKRPSLGIDYNCPSHKLSVIVSPIIHNTLCFQRARKSILARTI